MAIWIDLLLAIQSRVPFRLYGIHYTIPIFYTFFTVYPEHNTMRRVAWYNDIIEKSRGSWQQSLLCTEVDILLLTCEYPLWKENSITCFIGKCNELNVVSVM